MCVLSVLYNEKVSLALILGNHSKSESVDVKDPACRKDYNLQSLCWCETGLERGMAIVFSRRNVIAGKIKFWMLWQRRGYNVALTSKPWKGISKVSTTIYNKYFLFYGNIFIKLYTLCTHIETSPIFHKYNHIFVSIQRKLFSKSFKHQEVFYKYWVNYLKLDIAWFKTSRIK